NLTQPSIALAVVTGAFQFIQSRQMLAFQPKAAAGSPTDMAAQMNKQMIYLFPLLTVYFGWRLPSGLTLYWLITTLFAIGQQYLIMKDKQPAAVEVLPK